MALKNLVPRSQVLSMLIASCRFSCRSSVYTYEAKKEQKISRPFKPGGPSFMAGAGPQTDKASIEAAEKANLLYRKEEF